MKRKLLFAFMLSLIGISSLTGCKNEETPPVEDTSTDTTTTDETSETNTNSEDFTISEVESSETESNSNANTGDKYKDNEAYQVALKFIKLLNENRLKEAKDIVALYDNSVIADDHLIEILRTSEWGDLINTEGQFYHISFDQRYENRKYLTFKMNSSQYDIPLVIDHDGTWKVSLVDYIVENFQFVAPWEVDVYWDGKKLERQRYSTVINTGNTMLDLYTVTCTPTKIDFRFVSDSYGEFIREITPRYLNEPYELDRNFDQRQIDEVLTGIQNMWNEMFTDYTNNMPVDEWCYKHFAYITTPEQEKAVYDQIKDYLGEGKYLKIEMIDIKQWEGYFFGISMNRVATANFSYKLKMLVQPAPVEVEEKQPDGTVIKKLVEQEPKEIISDEIFSNIRVEKAAHGYIIFELTDPDLFNDKTNPVLE